MNIKFFKPIFILMILILTLPLSSCGYGNKKPNKGSVKPPMINEKIDKVKVTVYQDYNPSNGNIGKLIVDKDEINTIIEATNSATYDLETNVDDDELPDGVGSIQFVFFKGDKEIEKLTFLGTDSTTIIKLNKNYYNVMYENETLYHLYLQAKESEETSYD